MANEKNNYMNGIKVIESVLVISEGITEIPENAFEKRTDFTAVRFPSTILKIGGFAFADCTALQTLKFPPSLICVDCFAFMGCDCLREVLFLNERVVLEAHAFLACDGLERLVIGMCDANSLDKVPGAPVTGTNLAEAFDGCSNLKHIQMTPAAWEYQLGDWRTAGEYPAIGGLSGIEVCMLELDAKIRQVEQSQRERTAVAETATQPLTLIQSVSVVKRTDWANEDDDLESAFGIKFVLDVELEVEQDIAAVSGLEMEVILCRPSRPLLHVRTGLPRTLCCRSDADIVLQGARLYRVDFESFALTAHARAVRRLTIAHHASDKTVKSSDGEDCFHNELAFYCFRLRIDYRQTLDAAATGYSQWSPYYACEVGEAGNYNLDDASPYTFSWGYWPAEDDLYYLQSAKRFAQIGIPVGPEDFLKACSQ